jgi:hypothetical protein
MTNYRNSTSYKQHIIQTQITKDDKTHTEGTNRILKSLVIGVLIKSLARLTSRCILVDC